MRVSELVTAAAGSHLGNARGKSPLRLLALLSSTIIVASSDILDRTVAAACGKAEKMTATLSASGKEATRDIHRSTERL